MVVAVNVHGNIHSGPLDIIVDIVVVESFDGEAMVKN